MGMLTKYNDQQVRWVATTYDDYQYYFTDNEYAIYRQATRDPDIKVLHFRDGSLSVADIRRVEPYIPPPKNNKKITFTDEGFVEIKEK